MDRRKPTSEPMTKTPTSHCVFGRAGRKWLRSAEYLAMLISRLMGTKPVLQIRTHVPHTTTEFTHLPSCFMRSCPVAAAPPTRTQGPHHSVGGRTLLCLLQHPCNPLSQPTGHCRHQPAAGVLLLRLHPQRGHPPPAHAHRRQPLPAPGALQHAVSRRSAWGRGLLGGGLLLRTKSNSRTYLMLLS